MKASNIIATTSLSAFYRIFGRLYAEGKHPRWCSIYKAKNDIEIYFITTTPIIQAELKKRNLCNQQHHTTTLQALKAMS